jgi:hypothetical protein
MREWLNSAQVAVGLGWEAVSDSTCDTGVRSRFKGAACSTLEVRL